MDYLKVDVLTLKLNGQANFEPIEDAKIRILNSYNLEVELPRFRKENIKLSAENNVLHISAEQDNLKFYHSVSIPPTLDTNTIEAELDHGVLKISAQKAEQAKTKTIKIK